MLYFHLVACVQIVGAHDFYPAAQHLVPMVLPAFSDYRIRQDAHALQDDLHLVAGHDGTDACKCAGDNDIAGLTGYCLGQVLNDIHG